MFCGPFDLCVCGSFFNCYSITVVPIFPHMPPSAHYTLLLSQSIPTPLAMSLGHSYMFFVQSLPLISTIISRPSPLWSLLVCFLFPCPWFYLTHWVSLIGEIIQYLSFTNWLISLSIIFSSSIHAVTKDRSSVFLLHSIPFCKVFTEYFVKSKILCKSIFKCVM